VYLSLPIGGFTDIRGASPAQIAELVSSLGLPQYSERFMKHGVDGSLLVTLTPHDLKNELGAAVPPLNFPDTRFHLDCGHAPTSFLRFIYDGLGL